ncbi:phospholipid:diacylglycerol acyltransferase [Gautieria morchelliformis]|nr:phospholipid:diacylglycerol acyltransferase [Gautieria morchelliformis]
MVLSQRRPPTRSSPSTSSANDKQTDVRVKKRQKATRHYSIWTSRKVLFPLGVIWTVGAVLCVFVTSPYHARILFLLDQYGLPRFPELDWASIESEWSKVRSQIPEPWKLNNDGREFLVGETMHIRGLRPRHPVVLVPGIVSTGLESWSTSPDYRSYFREKLWGGYHMLTQVMLNREKWISALMLDPETGLDPPGIKLRAVQGIDAASSFIQGYWIWSKIIENLAAVGYDTNLLSLAAYDWRLSYYNLEVRDGYFSRLKTTIESFKQREGCKVVIAAHSMGSTVVLYFLKWVEAEGYGNGGVDWVENHIEAFVSVAGTHLGVPKAMTAFLSGEMKDTVQVNPAGAYVLERFFSRAERAKLFRSWAGSASMWIKGGASVWGNTTWAADDLPNAWQTHGQFVAFRPISGVHDPGLRNLTADEASNFILEHTPSTFQRMMATNYSFGIERDETVLAENDRNHTKWTNPLETRLPHAPSMKIYCVYGHGKETEASLVVSLCFAAYFHDTPDQRSYWYARGEYQFDETLDADAISPMCSNSTDCLTPRPPLDMPLSRKSWIDIEVSSDTSIPKVKNGVRTGEGDGTVALISLGGICVEGWKRSRWNPANISVITYELPHSPQANIPRGGATTGDHVDILGSTGVSEIILKVATGAGDEIQPRYVSRIREYAAQMQWD